MLFSLGGAEFHPQAVPWGECHVARNDTHHHRDYLPARRVQRPFWRLRLWHGPFRDGPWWRDFSRAAHPVAARQAVNQISCCKYKTYSLFSVAAAGFIIRPVRSRISPKRAYIKGCPEMTCTGAPRLICARA